MKEYGLILDAENIKDLVLLAKKAEAANFHSVWTTELYRTSFQQIAAVASATNKIKLGTAVALAFTRSPMITSLTALDIDEVSKGRFILGLGTGAKRTNENFHGIDFPDKPATRVKECIELINSLVNEIHTDNNIDYQGEYYSIRTRGFKRPFAPERDKIPVYLAGIGENMIRTSAEIADGYLGHVVCSLKYIKEVVRPFLDKGFAKRKNVNKNFKICSIITCAISDNTDEARKAAKSTIAFYATVRTYEPPFKLHGFTEQTKKIREAYFNKDIKAMIENVSEEMVDTFAVVGNGDFCRNKINEYSKYIDLPILSVPHYFIDFKDVRQYQQALLNAFGDQVR